MNHDRETKTELTPEQQARLEADEAVEAEINDQDLKKVKGKPTIEELEAILSAEEETALEILPNGEIRQLGRSRPDERSNKKPLTLREDLGGEYAEAA